MIKSKIQNPKSKINSNNKFQNSKHLNCHLLSVICFFIFAVSMLGCATIQEGVKKFVGISTKELEDGRGQAITRTFNHDYPTCYMQTQEILKQIGAYIYAKEVDKQMIAIYVSEEDTTPVGLFFNETGPATTRIEVSSPSEYAKEQIATKVFSGLEKSLIVEE